MNFPAVKVQNWFRKHRKKKIGNIVRPIQPNSDANGDQSTTLKDKNRDILVSTGDENDSSGSSDENDSSDGSDNEWENESSEADDEIRSNDGDEESVREEDTAVAAKQQYTYNNILLFLNIPERLVGCEHESVAKVSVWKSINEIRGDVVNSFNLNRTNVQKKLDFFVGFFLPHFLIIFYIPSCLNTLGKDYYQS